MRLKTVLVGLFAFMIPCSAIAQVPTIVEVPSLTRIQQTRLGKQLKQLENMHQRLKYAKSQLQYAKRRAQRNIRALKGLKDANWSNIEDINDNIRTFDNAQVNLTTIDDYVNENYEDLYNDYQRFANLEENPSQIEEFEADRYDALKNKVRGMIGHANLSDEASEKLEKDLERIRNRWQIEKNKEGGVGPQEQREINGQLQAVIANHLNGLQKLVGKYVEFASQNALFERDRLRDKEKATDVIASKYDSTKNTAMEKWIAKQDSSDKHLFGEFEGEMAEPESFKIGN